MYVPSFYKFLLNTVNGEKLIIDTSLIFEIIFSDNNIYRNFVAGDKVWLLFFFL